MPTEQVLPTEHKREETVKSEGVILGIDLGTTLSVAAVFDRDIRRVNVIPDGDSGRFVVPSVVQYPAEGEPVAGQEAVNNGAWDADRLARRMKMSMGKDFKKVLGGTERTPPEVAAEVLKRVKKNVERYLNVSADDFASIVITVPAYFEDPQSADTKKAAELAGFDMTKVRLLAEPCAAALAYVSEAKGLVLAERSMRVLVADLGGGTFDVTMIETVPFTADDGRVHLDIHVVCKDGSQELGGELWDEDLEKHVKAQCQASDGHHAAWVGNPNEGHRLREEVVKLKELLTHNEKGKAVCCIGKHQEVSRETFEDVTSGRLEEAEQMLRKVLKDDRQIQIERIKKAHPELGEDEVAKMVKQPDTVLLAGGASNMPQVKRMVRDVTGQEPLIHKNLEQIVAVGAAYEAALAVGQGPGTKIEEPKANQCPYCAKFFPPEGLDAHIRGCSIIIFHEPKEIVGENVGVAVLGDRFVVVLHKGVLEGVEEGFDNLGLAHDSQRVVRFEVFQGPHDDVKKNTPLGEALLTLKSDQPKGTKVEVILRLDKNKMIVGRGICHTNYGPEEVAIQVVRKF